MYLEEASVTGTETALLAAASAGGRTEIRNAADRAAMWWNCVSSW
jgi:UDP-N-acetylglucosamine enolpyruvyl transferase